MSVKVLNKKAGLTFDVVEFVPMEESAYIKMFEKNLPSQPFMNPVTDRLALWLFRNAGMLQRILHHLKHYHCIDPIYIFGKQYHPTEFSYVKEFIKFRDEFLDEKFKEGFIEHWKDNVMIALAKLSGKTYMSAGVD